MNCEECDHTAFIRSNLIKAFAVLALKWQMLLNTFGKKGTVLNRFGRISSCSLHRVLWDSAECIMKTTKYGYCIYRMFSDRQARANSVDPDETPQNAASHQGLYCLPLIQ